MSPREMESMLEMLAGSMGSIIGPVIATVLSGVILTYCIRWFIFAKAGERGWKALIPFYSDYINYKIAWDGRIYIALLIGTVASTVLGSVFGLINAGLGMVLSILMSTVVAGAKAIADLILKFKMARAFGKNDYFFIGLYFLNNVFTAILAFGDCEYKGAPKDQIGVPKFIENFGGKREPMDSYRPMQPMQPRPPVRPQPVPQQPVQQPAQPVQPYPQQPYNTGNYAPAQPYPQQPYNTGNYAPVQPYPQQPMNQNMMGQNPYHQG